MVSDEPLAGSVEPETCQHPDDQLKLGEDGYSRSWTTRIDRETQTVKAYFHGSEDWTDEGDGDMYLYCRFCGAHLPIPDGFEIDYQ